MMLLHMLLGCARSDSAAIPVATDTADSDTQPPDDSAADPGGLTLGDPVVCADPSARAATPLVPYDPGGAWAAQPTTPGDASATALGSIEAGGGITLADLDGDGLLDVYLPYIDGDRLYLGSADGTMVEDAAGRLPATDRWVYPFGAVAADLDADADLDLVIAYATGGPRLLLNDGTGHFSDGPGLDPPTDLVTAAVAVGDVDGDLDLDLVAAPMHDCQMDPGTSLEGVLWRNDGDAAFTDITGYLPAQDELLALLGRTVSLVDLDDDGDLDLHFEEDYRRGGTPCSPGDLVLLNDGRSYSVPDAALGLEIQGETMGLGIGDVNGDLLPDLAISDAALLHLLESDGAGGWYDGATARGLTFSTDDGNRYDAWGLELADLDNDGDLDLPAVFGPVGVNGPELMDEADAIWLQDDEGDFAQVAEDWGWADTGVTHSLAVLDLNGDGALDLVRRHLWGAADIALGVCGEAHWLEVELHDAAPNLHAIGAVVDVTAGDRTWRRWVLAGGTSLNVSVPPVVHVGVGEATEVDLSVRWPDGTVEVHHDVPVDRKVDVERL